MLLIFEKTVSEPNFAPTYAKFCKILFQEIKPESRTLFNTLLIKRIQQEFETNVNDADAKKLKLQPLVDKLEACTDSKERMELQAEIEDQEYQFRRRAWGTVRFIGEMYKLQSLTSDRVLLCTESLLEHGSEEKLEYMCKLLTTVGHLLEGTTSEHHNSNNRMDKIFRKIQEIINHSKGADSKGFNQFSSQVNSTSNQEKISSRVRFMMQDLLDLRSRNWDQPSVYSNQHHTNHNRRRQDDKLSHNNNTSGSIGGVNSNISSSTSGNNTTYNNERGTQKCFGYNANTSQSRLGRVADQDGRENANIRGVGEHVGSSANTGNYFLSKFQKSYGTQQEQHSIDVNKLNFHHTDDTNQSIRKLGNSSAYIWRTSGNRQTTNSSSIGVKLGTSNADKQQTNSKTALQSSEKCKTSTTINSDFGLKKQNIQVHSQMLSSQKSVSNSQSNENECDTHGVRESSTVKKTVSNEEDNDEDSDDSVPSVIANDNQELLNRLVEEVLDCGVNSNMWHKEIETIWQTTNHRQQISLLHYIFTKYLHLSQVKKLQRTACGVIFAYLIRKQDLLKKIYNKAYNGFAKECSELLIDVPNAWSYIFEFLGPMLSERLLHLNDVWRKEWRDVPKYAELFLKAFVTYFLSVFGSTYLYDLWHDDYKLDKGQLFMEDREKWNNFITTNGYQFLTNPQKSKFASKSRATSLNNCNNNNNTNEEQLNSIENLLNSCYSSQLAINYIQENVDINSSFVNSLMQFLCSDYATIISTFPVTDSLLATNSISMNNTNSNSDDKNNNRKNVNSGVTQFDTKTVQLNVELFCCKCIPLIETCAKSKEEESIVWCLDAIVNSLQQCYELNLANELICTIIGLIIDSRIMSKDVFGKWYKSRSVTQPQSGKCDEAETNTSRSNSIRFNQKIHDFLKKLL